MNTSDFIASDRHVIKLHASRSEAPKATVVIAHGMAEHGMRYHRLGAALNTHGLSMVAPDLRGHGLTSSANGVRGSFGVGGRARVIADLEAIIDREVETSNAPVFLFGHSMGSMLAMRIAQRRKSNLRGLVISAFPVHPGALVTAGKIMGKLMGAIKGSDIPSAFMDQLTFGKFSKGIKDRRTDFDWLSRNAEEVDRYIQDPSCGEVFSNRFFYELAALTDDAHKNLNLLPAELPILYIAGDDDPVVGKAKGFAKNLIKLRRYSPTIESKTYHGGRHELLNDLCRDETTNDLIAFVNRHL